MSTRSRSAPACESTVRPAISSSTAKAAIIGRAISRPLDSVEAGFRRGRGEVLKRPTSGAGAPRRASTAPGSTQTALTAAGVAAPRDSDMLETLGVALPADAALKRGDLVFWKGHVGSCATPKRLLHANGHHMAVVSEPLARARERIPASGGGGITSIRRL